MKTRKDKTLEWRGMVVTYDFTPEEPEVRYYRDGSGYPGAPAEVDIKKIEIDSYDDFVDDFGPDPLPEEGEDDYFDWIQKNEPSILLKIADQVFIQENE